MPIERFYKENTNAIEIEKLKKELNIKKDDFVLLFVGRLGKEKSVDFLIDAHKSLIKSIPNAKLIIIGDGPEKDEFKNMVTKNKLESSVKFTGMVPWDKIPNYYQVASIFVTASTTETQGLTLIEAMASGKPPVCIDDESFKLVVVDDLNGKIFKTKNDYKKIIVDLYNDKSKLKSMSKQARINAELHGSKHFAEQVLDVYKHAIENKKGRFGLVSSILKKITK